MGFRHPHSTPLPREPRLLHGTPGMIYILENSALRAGLYRIGSTRRSGTAKAMEFNRDLSNALPGAYECVFELHCKDCGRALESIHAALRSKRRGRQGQEFFELPLEEAIDLLTQTVAAIHRAELRRRVAPAPVALLPREESVDARRRASWWQRARAWINDADHAASRA